MAKKARIVRSDDGEVYESRWRFKQGSLTGGRFDFMIGTVDYLSGPPMHTHRDQDDTFFVIEGRIAIQLDDEMVELGPGDFVSIPPGVAHTFDNIDKDQPPPRVLNLMTPGGLDAQFHDAALREAAGSDALSLDEINAKHGITVVGPTLGEKLGLA